MQTIGILGGMSAASTQLYYAELCRLTRARRGGLRSPPLLIRSLDFAEIEKLQAAGAWDTAGAILNAEARALVRGGAELLLLATNTMHKVADRMMANVQIPLLDIAGATADALCAAGFGHPGLLATAFTMEQTFYTDRLIAAGLRPVLPNPADRRRVHRIIYEELCHGVTTPASEPAFVEIAARLRDAGADSLILGCTEVGLLLHAGNAPLPVFDTTLIHCEAAVDRALG